MSDAYAMVSLFPLHFYCLWFFYQRLGAVFPKRSESSAPVFTPPQTHPLSSYPQNLRNPEPRADGAESSAEAEFPTLRCIFLDYKHLDGFLFSLWHVLVPLCFVGIMQCIILYVK